MNCKAEMIIYALGMLLGDATRELEDAEDAHAEELGAMRREHAEALRTVHNEKAALEKNHIWHWCARSSGGFRCRFRFKFRILWVTIFTAAAGRRIFTRKKTARQPTARLLIVFRSVPRAEIWCRGGES